LSVTLDGQSLNVTDWAEDLQLLSTSFDKWENGSAKRKLTVHGYVRSWTLECIEQDVAWASSRVKYFEEKAAAGAILAFASTLAVRNVSSTNVQVVRVSFSANDLANQNVRIFSLELQEVL
jgi:hypothetical protein